MDLDHDACYQAVCARDARFDGRFFTAVKTTGIYCRPVCPARTPQSANVVFYPTAAAAQEAGFRPCLRCRPEAVPDLRPLPGKTEVLAGSHPEVELLLPYLQPYDWPDMLEFLRRRAIPGIERVTADQYVRSVQFNGAQGTVAVRVADRNALCATLRFPDLSVVPVVIARLRRVFDLATDPIVIAEHLAKDPVLAALVQARPGLRVPGAWDGFELAIRAVLGQQITVAAAVRLAGRLVAAYGPRMVQPDGDLIHVFPEPEVLASADLASLGMPRSRAAALSAVAAAAMADTHLFDASRGLDDAIRRLCLIRGVGEWTAQYIALRQMREPDAFPASDIVLLRSIAKLEGRDYSPSQLIARAQTWRPWRAYAAQHLWVCA